MTTQCVEVRGHSPGPSGCYWCVISTHLPVGLLLSSYLLPSPDTGLPGQSLGPTYCRLCGLLSLQATAALHSEATLVLSSAGENAIHIVPIHCVYMYRCLISMYISAHFYVHVYVPSAHTCTCIYIYIVHIQLYIYKCAHCANTIIHIHIHQERRNMFFSRGGHHCVHVRARHVFLNVHCPAPAIANWSTEF